VQSFVLLRLSWPVAANGEINPIICMNVLTVASFSLQLVGRERMEVAQQLSIWGENCDDDVSDVTDKIGVLLYEIGELEDQYVDRYDQYRVTIKSIRNIEASGIMS
jgi:Eisosome component PIL1